MRSLTSDICSRPSPRRRWSVVPSAAGFLIAAACAASSLALANPPTHAPCATGKATSAAAKCMHCNAFKALIALVKEGRARLETCDVEHGVLVQVTAAHPDGVPAVHEAMGQIQAVSQAAATPGAEVHICDLCRARMDHLVKASHDWAKTTTGATLMLTSEDPELVAWLRQDGHAQQALVDRVASR